MFTNTSRRQWYAVIFFQFIYAGLCLGTIYILPSDKLPTIWVVIYHNLACICPTAGRRDSVSSLTGFVYIGKFTHTLEVLRICVQIVHDIFFNCIYKSHGRIQMSYMNSIPSDSRVRIWFEDCLLPCLHCKSKIVALAWHCGAGLNLLMWLVLIVEYTQQWIAYWSNIKKV